MAIENIQKKEEVKTSKIKKAFKKMKNAFIVGTAALMITCGGSEIDTHNDGNNNSSVNKLPAEIEAYADEINLKHTYNIFDHMNYSGDFDDNPLLPLMIDYCSEKYGSVGVENNLDKFIYYNINDITSPKEFIFKTKTQEFPEVLNKLKGNEFVTMHIKERARPPPGIFYDFDGLGKERFFSKYDISVFNYYYNFNENVLESAKPPAVILCYLRYNDDLIEQYISFGRMVVVPYDDFMNKATTVMPKEEIMERLSKYFTDN